MRTRLFLLASLFLGLSDCRADHYAGGTISTRCLGNNFHEITLQLLLDCSGTVLIPQSLYLSNDCGVSFSLNSLQPVSEEEVSTLCPSELPNSTCNGGTLVGYELVTYRTTAFLSPCTNWVISWYVCCRGSAFNVLGPSGIYIETTVNNPGGICNAAPEFVNNTIPTACIGQEVEHDASAVDVDGNELSYALVDARFANPAPLPLTYFPGYSGTEPFEGMAIDPNTGMVTFVPSVTGSMIVVVEVTERGSDGQILGKVMRDFLFVVIACDNQPPSSSSGIFTTSDGAATVSGARELTICGTEPFCAAVTISDVDEGQQIAITSDVTSTLPGASLTITGTNPIEAELCWTPSSTGLFQFTLTATDDACPYAGSRTYPFSVNVTSAPLAGTNAAVSVCENGSPFNMLDSLNGFPTIGGQWLDPNGDPTNGIFTPGFSLNGIHTYTVGQPPCSAFSVLSVVTLASNEPACITAGAVEKRSFIPSIRQDPFQGHHLWISNMPPEAQVTLLAADGRLLQRQSLPAQLGGPSLIEVPAAHRGLVLVEVRSLPSGVRHVERLVVQ